MPFSGIIYAYSPSAKIERLDNGNYLITITDKDGTTTAEIYNNDSSIEVRTTAEWNGDREFPSKKGVLYVYSDYKQIEKDGKIVNIPGLKLGDDNSYVIDLPFTDEAIYKDLFNHINNHEIHITSAERNFWNNKVRCYMQLSNDEDNENLIFTIN